jgi:NADH:ubiquinone oxidoreductase subunit E
MNLASSDVFGVASFYALFSMEPKGRHMVKVCTGTACYVKGIKEVISRICNEYDLEEGGTSSDMRFTLEPVRCLGACGLAPVMVINSDTHGDVSSDKVVDILQAYE